MSKRSFSVLEIIVVIVIIGILAALGIPQYQKVVERARQTEGLVFLSQVHASQNRYYYEHDYVYPTTSAALDIGLPVPKFFENLNLDSDGSATVDRNSQSAGNWEYSIKIDKDGVLSYEAGSGPGLP